MQAPLYLTAMGIGYDSYGGHDVWLGPYKIGYRKYDGSDSEDVLEETGRALAELLRDKLGWSEEAPDDEEW